VFILFFILFYFYFYLLYVFHVSLGHFVLVLLAVLFSLGLVSSVLSQEMTGKNASKMTYIVSSET